MKIFALGLIITLAFVRSVFADTVLTKGVNYNGEIIEETNDYVTILWNGKIKKKINRKDIKDIRYGKSDKTQTRTIQADSVKSNNAPQAKSGSDRNITKDCFGCIDKDYYSKLLGYARDGDRNAFNRALAEGVVSGRCTTFDRGEKVFTTDTAIFSGLLKVRRNGETSDYWTNMENVSGPGK